MLIPDLSLTALRRDYLRRRRTPRGVIEEILSRLSTFQDNPIWISRVPDAELRVRADRLAAQDPAGLPLYGIPFAIKDNIDLAGLPTTAACPAFAYRPTCSAPVVERLIAAGAIPMGKTNLDQFATGLVGVRSPYGVTRNAFDPDYIAGGSSSGSAVAVAQGLASFALGTDTAGSGRVPAAFNGLVGLKPSRGLLSTRGVVPACRTLDCVSIFARNTVDADAVFQVAAHFDPADPYARELLQTPAERRARFLFGIPHRDQLEFFGNQGAARAFQDAVDQVQRMGGEAVTLDFTPFLAVARLLYEGPWVAERYAAIADFIQRQPEALFPVTRAIIEPATQLSAIQAFEAQYQLQTLKRQTDALLAGLEFIVTPTAGTIYTLAEVEADPIRLNANLGYYTNFMNLLDYSAVAIPAGTQNHGLPFGVTLFSFAGCDRRLLAWAEAFERAVEEPGIDLLVCGAHLSGLPLNSQLTERRATLVEATRTAPCYRLYALAGGPPLRPGLVRDEANGAGIEVEIWRLPLAALGSFMASIPAPLGIGTVEVESGRWVKGFICEPYALATATDVTTYGGWRAYLASR
ncbi:MAG TPA: allophanate hydrolase [Candidatus Competibacteraceae bacterium]|nr:allophanate hydrolase [Candidatus Competibacteraceae bacterium]HRZ06935.1 allophanate hydrolase [Candidatus Competibacteraceae bacterium]